MPRSALNEIRIVPVDLPVILTSTAFSDRVLHGNYDGAVGIVIAEPGGATHRPDITFRERSSRGGGTLVTPHVDFYAKQATDVTTVKHFVRHSGAAFTVEGDQGNLVVIPFSGDQSDPALPYIGMRIGGAGGSTKYAAMLFIMTGARHAVDPAESVNA